MLSQPGPGWRGAGPICKARNCPNDPVTLLILQGSFKALSWTFGPLDRDLEKEARRIEEYPPTATIKAVRSCLTTTGCRLQLDPLHLVLAPTPSSSYYLSHFTDGALRFHLTKWSIRDQGGGWMDQLGPYGHRSEALGG